MDYSITKINYDLFLLNTLLEDYKLEVCINESILIASGNPTINQFKIIHEGFIQKIKETFSKLLTSIATLWKKFVYTMDTFLSSDKAYLEKHKDIITKKPLAEEEYIMFPYWEGYNQMANFKVPAFNYPVLKSSLVSKDEFISKHFNQYMKKDSTLNDSLRFIFRGNTDKEQKTPSSKIDLNSMYDYCLGFGSLKKRLETDMKEIEKAGDSAIDIIDRMKSDVNSNESAIYSFIKEAVIYEALPQKVSDIEKKDGQEKDSSIDGKSDIDKEQIETSATDKNTDINNIKTYLEVCYGALGVKMSIAQECYKSYMFIIRDHVKAHTGSTGKESNKKSSTDTTKDSKLKSNDSTEKTLVKGWMDKMKPKEKK